MFLEFCGVMSNALAIFSNGALMPVLKSENESVWGAHHQRLKPDTKFKLLCDIISIKGYTLSLGDLAQLIGDVLLASLATAFIVRRFAHF